MITWQRTHTYVLLCAVCTLVNLLHRPWMAPSKWHYIMYTVFLHRPSCAPTQQMTCTLQESICLYDHTPFHISHTALCNSYTSLIASGGLGGEAGLLFGCPSTTTTILMLPLPPLRAAGRGL